MVVRIVDHGLVIQNQETGTHHFKRFKYEDSNSKGDAVYRQDHY